jgi:hypothetical protein
MSSSTSIVTDELESEGSRAWQNKTGMCEWRPPSGRSAPDDADLGLAYKYLVRLQRPRSEISNAPSTE